MTPDIIYSIPNVATQLTTNNGPSYGALVHTASGHRSVGRLLARVNGLP
jgi:hypothetical protein